MSESNRPRILLTGATGYVGGRLLEALESKGLAVRCMARRPEYLAARVGPSTTVVQGDCLEASTLAPAFEGVETAFYLIHSMGTTKDFAEQDRRAASNFGSAAKQAGVRRIIYLGGLGDSSEDLSKHLRSRQETGEVLRDSGVPVIEFRASIVLGSGSLSFELIRNLVERLPVMVCPRWVQVKAQPIHIQDVIDYLMAGIDLPGDESRVFEIGGEDQVSYGEIMREYAKQRGLRRTMIPVPMLTPYVSALWLGLTTPLYARVGRKLISSIKFPTVVRDDSAMRAFDIRPIGLSEAIRQAASNEDRAFAATRWSDAISSGREPRSWGGVKFGSRLVDARSMPVDVPPAAAFAPIRRIGGKVGWYYGNWLWRVRGFIDLLIGGVGLRRGRRDAEQLQVGETLDFWRVEAYEPDRLLRLSAEMRLPGRAWLEFEVRPGDDGGSVIHQTAVFDPVGLFGLLYWYGIYALHGRVFGGMLRGIARAAREEPSVFYFAYGSNADPERFTKRVGPWRSRRRAKLAGYRLRFARMVQSEGGGGAVVDRHPGAHVDGVLYEISAAQLAAMDREEFDPSRDVASTGKRIRESVEAEDGAIDAELYTVDDDGESCAPSQAYLRHILRGLEAAGHDEAALAAVRAAAARR